MVSSRRYGGSSTPSQPAMIGESRLVRRTKSTVPGMLNPTARTSLAGRSEAVEQFAERGHDLGHQLVGGGADLLVQVDGGQDLAVQVAHAELGAAAPDRPGQYDARVAVEPQPDRRPATGGGRAVLVGSLPRPDPTRARQPTRAATAVRDRPVTRPISLRVPAWPSRTSENTSPVVAGPGLVDMASLKHPRVSRFTQLTHFCLPKVIIRLAKTYLCLRWSLIQSVLLERPLMSPSTGPPQLPAPSPSPTSSSSAAPATWPSASCCPRSTCATATASCPPRPGSSPCHVPVSTSPATATRSEASCRGSSAPTSSTRPPSTASRPPVPRHHRHRARGWLVDLVESLDDADGCGSSTSPSRPRSSDRSASRLAEHGLVTPSSRLVLEKPIGTDLASAHEINDAVGAVFEEARSSASTTTSARRACRTCW